MNLEELNKLAREYVKENFGLELNIPIVENPRLSRALGRFIYRNQYGREPRRIEVSKRLLQYYDYITIKDVLYHELIHYSLFMLGKPHSDGDLFFESTLKAFGVTRTGVIQNKGKVHQYQCGCMTHNSNRKLPDNKKYRCSKCKGDLTYLGQKII